MALREALREAADALQVTVREMEKEGGVPVLTVHDRDSVGDRVEDGEGVAVRVQEWLRVTGCEALAVGLCRRERVPVVLMEILSKADPVPEAVHVAVAVREGLAGELGDELRVREPERLRGVDGVSVAEREGVQERECVGGLGRGVAVKVDVAEGGEAVGDDSAVPEVRVWGLGELVAEDEAVVEREWDGLRVEVWESDAVNVRVVEPEKERWGVRENVAVAVWVVEQEGTDADALPDEGVRVSVDEAEGRDSVSVLVGVLLPLWLGEWVLEPLGVGVAERVVDWVGVAVDGVRVTGEADWEPVGEED